VKQQPTLALAIIFTFAAAALFAGTVSRDMNAKLDRLERYVYGKVNPGEPLARLKSIEKLFFGRVMEQPAAEKADFLHDFVFEGSKHSTPMEMKLSYLEWSVFNASSSGSFQERLEKADRAITGSSGSDLLAFRLEQLVNMYIPDGNISRIRVVLPAGTSVLLESEEVISSVTAKKGDVIQMRVAEDLFLGGNLLVISNNSIVTPVVRSVRRGGRFGRTGYINLDLSKIETMDSTPVKVSIEDVGDKLNPKSVGMAAGASALGYLVLGPIGIGGGAFIKGGEIEVPSGTIFRVKTVEDTVVTGILVPRKQPKK